jgi:hypothetical protein
MSSEFLKSHITALSDFSRQTSERLSKNPSDFWLRMAAKNQTQTIGDVTQELKIVCAEESGELLDLRFIGPKAEGSIPLDAFIRIIDPLSKAWKSAAFRIRHGVTRGRIGAEISDALNLKLAGLAYGSTRILVTGNATPDLSGESLLQATLMQTFNLLSAKNNEFYDAVDAVGGRAAQYFGEAMKAIDSAGLSAEFSWQSPNGRLTWYGTSDEVIRIKGLIDAVTEPESYEEKISGVVSGIADTGRLEIRTVDGRILVRFPLDLTGVVQQLSIAKSATIRVKTTKYWDVVSKKDIFKRLMIDLVTP